MGAGRLVTPEAVQLDLPAATVATRALARLVDVVLQLVVGTAIAAGGIAVAGDGASDVVVTVVVLLAAFAVRVLYPVVMETRLGATVGHLALGLRIVTTDGGQVRGRQALTRAAVGLFEVEATLGVVALLVAGSRSDGRRLGDLAAGTLAVSVRSGTGRAEPLDVAVPPRLAGWAEAVDPAGLGPRERAALRRYLERAPSLPTATRDELAVPLRDTLCAAVGVPPPPDATAHDTLLALAAVR